MIDLYFWATPNGRKISIALEELELPYKVFPINIARGEQFQPEFLAKSPNNRIPAIVDHAPAGGGAPISVFESGAILLYLADKTGQLIPRDVRDRTQVLEWLMWQMGGIGPMFGQANHFVAYAPEKIPYAIDRYLNEAKRLIRVLDTRLTGREFVAGAYSIADIASYPWVVSARDRLVKDEFNYPNVVRWLDAIATRPAVVRGMAVSSEARTQAMDDEARKHLFGQR
ncbi:MAG TPA: glutathione S-transferase N-terminal domain-containing protein [Kofleriaceae bacterium]